MTNEIKTNLSFLTFQILAISLIVKFQNNNFLMIITLVLFLIIHFYFEQIIFKLGIISKLPKTIQFSNNVTKSYNDKLIKVSLFTVYSLIILILSFFYFNENFTFLYIAFGLSLSSIINVFILIQNFNKYQKEKYI